jgi:hypothetical protein
MGDKPKTLTQNQRRFVEEYVTEGSRGHGNAVQAYFRAYGRVTKQGKRRTYQSAQAASSRLLSNVIVKAEVEAAQAEYSARIRVDKARTLRETACVAFFDPADAFDRDPAGGPLVAKPLHDIPAATRRAIQSVKYKRRRLKGDGDEVYEVEEVEYKFASKMDALDKLSKKLGFYAAEGGQSAAADLIGELLRGAIGGAIRDGDAARRETQQPGGAGGGGPAPDVADA